MVNNQDRIERLREAGRKGGQVTGGIKAQKSAENGKKGGRPPLTPRKA